ncbi:cytochrome P450 [Apiospora marii]|uniref:Cytochrome P450 n=1 Tax=Apiospora marii TaxID=335849 RepID=A0ABR1S8H4_9PEZI
MTSLWFLSVLVALGYVLTKLLRIGRRPPGYPPGPPTVPLLGNLHLMPKENPHLQMKKWAEEYGPIFSLMLGTQATIVLSSDQAVKDLLDKRGSIYNSRPDLYIARIVSNNHRMLFMVWLSLTRPKPTESDLLWGQHGERWRVIHKLFHVILNVRAAKAYVPYQDLEAKRLMCGLLDEPDLWIDHVRRFTTSLVTQMIYGFRTTSIHDPQLKRLYDVVDEFVPTIGSTGAALFDLYPILRKFPDWMLPAKKKAKVQHANEKQLFLDHWTACKERINNKTSLPCFGVDVFNAQKGGDFSDDEAAYVAATILEAGYDTTANTIMGFIEAMILYPDTQKAAQEELDRVCGGRMPVIDDAPNLPYIRAIVKETLRWMPTAILGVPHCAMRDDDYMGYKIPKNASMVTNVWGIHRDPKRYAHPDIFDPTRYLGDDQIAAEAAANPDVSKRDHFVFGSGRRICVGMHTAERSLFLAMSRILWALRVEKAVGPDGREITPDPARLSQGFLVHPEPFPMKLTARSAERAQTVREEWGRCETLLDANQQWKAVPEGMKFSASASE